MTPKTIFNKKNLTLKPKTLIMSVFFVISRKELTFLNMELNKDQIFLIAQEKIKEFKIDRIASLFGHLPIDIRTFYKCFPVGSERYNLLVELTNEYQKSEI